VITARFAEVGQVVEQARAIFSIAKDGPRDAVFDVYEAIFAQVPDDAIGGIIVGTVLTLVFLPALYVAWYRIEAPDETRGAIGA